MSWFNNGEPMFPRNATMQTVVDEHNDKLIAAYLVHGKDIKPGMIVRSYDNVLGPLSEGSFDNGLPITILSTMSYVEGKVAHVGEHKDIYWNIVEIHADKAGEHVREGSNVRRLHVDKDEPKQYFPPQEYFFIVMYDPDSPEGFYYHDKQVFELDSQTPLRLSQLGNSSNMNQLQVSKIQPKEESQ